MSDPVESKAFDGGLHTEKGISQVEDASNLDEKAQLDQYKAAAMEAENAEHNMGVPEAVRAYPMAALWAFIMSCTIVSRVSSLGYDIARRRIAANTIGRLWSPIVSSLWVISSPYLHSQMTTVCMTPGRINV